MFRDALQGAFVLLTFSLAIPLQIEVQPKIFQLNDKDAKLTCSNADHTKSDIHQMTKLRLKRLADGGVWRDVASLNHDGSTEVSDINVTATGDLGDVSKSYLSVTWSVVSSHVYGKYRCDSVGYSLTGDIEVEESSELEVRGMSKETLQLYRLLQEYQAKDMKEFKAMITEQIINISVCENHKRIIDNNVKEANINGPEKEEVQWPEGDFTLLMPDTGCPLQPAAWNKGFWKGKALHSDHYYPLNIAVHLASPYIRYGFIYQQFCSLKDSPDRQQAWPSGSYCMNTFNKACLSGFEHTRLNMDLDDNIGNEAFGTFPGEMQSTYKFFKFFCCRHDGSPNTPIILPTSQPFYLYRHRGTCQKVKDMDVSQDMFIMATGHDDKGDSWVSGDEHYRPDVYLKPVIEELCYYVKK